VVPGKREDQEPLQATVWIRPQLWMNKLPHNQENWFQTGLTLALTLRTAVIHVPLFKDLLGHRTSQAKAIQTDGSAGQAYSPIIYFSTERILHPLIYKRDDWTGSAVPVGTLKRKLQSLRCLRYNTSISFHNYKLIPGMQKRRRNITRFANRKFKNQIC